MAELPPVGQPGVEVAHGPGGQIHQQLRQVELRIDVVPSAGRGQARQDGICDKPFQAPCSVGEVAVFIEVEIAGVGDSQRHSWPP